MSISDRLNLLQNTKEVLRQELGLGTEVPFSEYHNHVGGDTFTPMEIFETKTGGWLDLADITTMYQDLDATQPLENGSQELAIVKDKTGNGFDAVQSGGFFGSVSYNDSTGRVPMSGDFGSALSLLNPNVTVGTLVCVTDNGTHFLYGDYGSTIYEQFGVITDCFELLIFEGRLTKEQKSKLEVYYYESTGGERDSPVGDISYDYAQYEFLLEAPLMDTSEVTKIVSTWANCKALEQMTVLDFSSVTVSNQAWQGCNSLVSFPLVDLSNSLNMNSAWSLCGAMTEFKTTNFKSATTISGAWQRCTILPIFPEIELRDVTSASSAWAYCQALTDFPELDFKGCTNFFATWSYCTGLTSFPTIKADSGTAFRDAWKGCTSLVDFNYIDFKGGAAFYQTWYGCTSLTNFPANVFDNVTGKIFTGAFTNTNLSQDSIDNILVSINSTGTSSGTFGQSGGSAPSAVGKAAIDQMRSRSWNITVTGGY